MYLGHVSGRKVVLDCRRLGSSASDCRLQKEYPLCACQHTDKYQPKVGMAFKTKIWHVDFPNLIRHQKIDPLSKW